MKLYVFTLFLLAMVLSCSCSLEHLMKCVTTWEEVKKLELNDNWHCARLKATSKCAIEGGEKLRPGALLDGSLYMLIESMFMNKHNMCPTPLDVTALREALKETGILEKHKDLLIDNDEPAPCAKKVVEKCLVQYHKIYCMGSLCTALQMYINCVRAEAETHSCDAPIMKRIVKTLEVILEKALTELLYEKPKGCQFIPSKNICS